VGGLHRRATHKHTPLQGSDTGACYRTPLCVRSVGKGLCAPSAEHPRSIYAACLIMQSDRCAIKPLLKSDAAVPFAAFSVMLTCCSQTSTLCSRARVCWLLFAAVRQACRSLAGLLQLERDAASRQRPHSTNLMPESQAMTGAFSAGDWLALCTRAQ